MMARIYPVILSGGVGSRLWPLSRAERPKQFHRLHTQHTLFQETALRLPDAQAPLIICSRDHKTLVGEQLRDVRLSPRAIILEPVGRNTAPAALLAALQIAETDETGVMLLLPSDHIISDAAAFKRCAHLAAEAASSGYIATFGIKPESPHTGYGYIRGGAPLAEAAGAVSVAQFVEKPDKAKAEAFLKSGDYFWNSGMFAVSAQTLLREAARISADLLPPVETAYGRARRTGEFIELNEADFANAKNISIDHAIMEHTRKAALIPSQFGWSDVGSWEALWEIGEKTSEGVTSFGETLALNSRNCLLHSEGPLVAVTDLDDIVVVATKDAVLVTRKDSSQNVKNIVERLKHMKRPLV